MRWSYGGSPLPYTGTSTSPGMLGFSPARNICDALNNVLHHNMVPASQSSSLVFRKLKITCGGEAWIPSATAGGFSLLCAVRVLAH